MGFWRDIVGLLAAEILSKSLLGIGLFLMILGGIIVYVVTDLVTRSLGVEPSTARMISAAASIITSLFGLFLLATGIALLIWARNKKV